MRIRKTTIFAKLETVYGTAVALAGEDAIRTHEASVTPFVASLIDRNLDGAAFGNSGGIHAGAHVEVEFDVEMSGSGAAGTAPARRYRPPSPPSAPRPGTRLPPAFWRRRDVAASTTTAPSSTAPVTMNFVSEL